MNDRLLGSCGYALGTKTDLALRDGAVVLTSPFFDADMSEPVGRMLDHERLLVTSPSQSIRTAAYRATMPVLEGWPRNGERCFTYTGERRTDTDTGRDCAVWRLQ